ncbi:RING/FYVE/PHD zinc finger superfamily protein [Actinidia rufa]|uniref:RING/FYVE/PHD zinc finger superfamily protein n=1 Tax=Actinidia rufa TaxID=165716 RepID=A0A7J0H9N2_9ERIC|nr:RING/FYVE/PHD zinc finger superfamily protein [Actinidia rufa]
MASVRMMVVFGSYYTVLPRGWSFKLALQRQCNGRPPPYFGMVFSLSPVVAGGVGGLPSQEAARPPRTRAGAPPTNASPRRSIGFWALDPNSHGESSESNFSSEDVDLESGELELKLHLAKEERECRICHLNLVRDEESGVAIELGCDCKGDLAAAHKQCAETWFKIRGNM